MTPSLDAQRVARALGQPPPTAEQQAVIEAPLEPLLVVAGAGSGKTETMSARVVWLVANGLVAPQDVLGLTFTRKAAGELAERISRRLRQLREAGLWSPAQGEEDLVPTVSTYHAYAGRLVSEHGLRLGHEPGARLLSEASCWQLAEQVVSDYTGPLEREARTGKDDVPAVSTVTEAVLALSGQLAEHLRTPRELEDYLDRVVADWDALPYGEGRRSSPKVVTDALAALRGRRAILPLVRAYARAKRERESLDFADQLSLAAQLARTYPDVGRAERARHRVVLLDEFQDTSEAQLVLLRELYAHPLGDVPVMAVGDPHQSIYGWRGASATTLTSFPRHFPTQAGPARTLPLSTSWRNDADILQAANVVAAPLTAQCPVEVKVLSPRPGAGRGRVEAARLETAEEEAAHVADWLAARLLPPDGADPAVGHAGAVGADVVGAVVSDAVVSDGALADAEPTSVSARRLPGGGGGATAGADGSTGTTAGPGGGDRPTAAVLCRKRSQLVPLAEALETRGLPVEVVGVGGLLGMPEVVDLVAFLHVVDDPDRGDHLVRLLTGSLVRLGAADLAALHDWARALQREAGPDGDERVGLVEALDRLPPVGWTSAGGRRLSETARTRLARLRAQVRRVREMIGLGLPELVAEAERVLGLDVEVLSQPGRAPGEARTHLDALVDIAAEFAAGADRPTLSGLLAWLDAADARERGLSPGQVTPVPGAVQLLTVHASKGLEWDVVVVPGLDEGTFPAGTVRVAAGEDGWGVGPRRDKGWLAGLASLPYALRGDAAGLPSLDPRGCDDHQDLGACLDAFTQACGEHALTEERRLAYVALTRARSELLLTTAVWRHQRTPRVTSGFLEELRAEEACEVTTWAPMPPVDPTPTNPALERDESAAWPPPSTATSQLVAAAEAVRAALERPASADEEGAGAEIDRQIDVLLAERERARTERGALVTMPAHLSTSALVSLTDDPDAFVLDLRRPLPAAPATAARRGTAFHAWVEEHYSRAAMMDLGELPGSADAALGDEGSLDVMKEHFLASEWAGREPVEIELAVESTIAGTSIRGRIDAVFPRPGGGWTVVDWKTGEPPRGRRARVREIQLAVYRLAYARLRGVAPDQVDAAFYYAATGETVRPRLPDEAELERLVSETTGG